MLNNFVILGTRNRFQPINFVGVSTNAAISSLLLLLFWNPSGRRSSNDTISIVDICIFDFRTIPYQMLYIWASGTNVI